MRFALFVLVLMAIVLVFLAIAYLASFVFERLLYFWGLHELANLFQRLFPDFP